MKADSMNAEREGECSLKVTLEFGTATGLWSAQSLTHRMAAELMDAIEPEIPMSHFRGSLRVDPGVIRHAGCLRAFIVFEAMDEADLERAEALVSVVHDMTELLV